MDCWRGIIAIALIACDSISDAINNIDIDQLSEKAICASLEYLPKGAEKAKEKAKEAANKQIDKLVESGKIDAETGKAAKVLVGKAIDKTIDKLAEKLSKTQTEREESSE